MSTFQSPLNSGSVSQNAVGFATLSQVATITFANTTALPMFNIPYPYLITSILVDVLVAFNSSGTDLLSFGTTGTPTLLGSALDVSSTGRKSVSTAGANVTQLGAWYSATDDGNVLAINGLYTQSVADATTGSARVTIEYCVPKILNP